MTEPNTETHHAGTTVENGPKSADSTTPKMRSGKLSVLAFLLACVAISLQFYPDIRDSAERLAGPLPWLPRQILPVEGVVIEQPPGNAVASVQVQEDALLAIEQLQEKLLELTAPIEEIDRIKTTAGSALKAADEAGLATVKLNNQMKALETVIAQRHAEVTASLSDLTEAYSKLAQPSEAPLIAARLVLLAAAGDLSPQDIDPLAGIAGANTALSDIAGQLKALSGEDIPTVTALQAQFNTIKDVALQRALAARLGWMQSSVSAAQAALSDIGLIRPEAEEKDAVVINAAARQMDSGRLRKALFELQAASPELRQQLAPWTSAAQLRVTLDQTLQQLIDGLLTLKNAPPVTSGAN